MLLKKEADGRAASLPNLCWGTWRLLCDCQTAMINDWRELEFTDCPSNFFSLKILIKYLKDTVKPVSANLQLTFIDKGTALLLGGQGERFELKRWMVDAMSFFGGGLFVFLNVHLNNWKICSIYCRYFRMTSSFYSVQLEHNSVPRQMNEALTSSEKDIQ